MAAGESNYNASVDSLQRLVDRAMLEAQNSRSMLWALPPQTSLREPAFDVKLTKPNMAPPPTMTDLFVEGDSTDPSIKYLSEQSDEWVAKYFPAIAGNMRTVPEDIVCAIIGGTHPLGLDATVFEIVWHNARDRAYRTVRSESRQIEASFSARGFSLPQGAMVDALAQVEQRATESILEVNKEQAIKDATMKLEMLQFAIEAATRLKLGIMSALGDFYRAWMTLPDKDIERARIKAAAMSSLYSALSSYYNVEMGFQELTLKAAQTGADIDVAVDRNRLNKQQIHGNTASGLASAVQSYTRIAESAASSMGTLTAEIESL